MRLIDGGVRNGPRLSPRLCRSMRRSRIQRDKVVFSRRRVQKRKGLTCQVYLFIHIHIQSYFWTSESVRSVRQEIYSFHPRLSFQNENALPDLPIVCGVLFKYSRL